MISRKINSILFTLLSPFHFSVVFVLCFHSTLSSIFFYKKHCIIINSPRPSQMYCQQLINFSHPVFQHVDEENSYLCGYLGIKGLTEEFPTLTTFFDGEIISKKYPFLTRKWDADEDVDKKHWVCIFCNRCISSSGLW